MADVRAAGQPVRVVDIAAGHGRYVLDAIDRAGALPDSILLRDYSRLNVEQGSALIQARSLEHVARFVEGDAFDRASLAAIAPPPTIGIVSGLYELFPDNTQVRDIARRTRRRNSARRSACSTPASRGIRSWS